MGQLKKWLLETKGHHTLVPSCTVFNLQWLNLILVGLSWKTNDQVNSLGST